MKQSFETALIAPIKQNGFELPAERLGSKAHIQENSHGFDLKHGSVVIAAITSCTNTSNPSVMIGAGLVAKKAVEKGLSVAPQVKTSLAPGSKVVTDYLRDAGLIEPLEALHSTSSATAARPVSGIRPGCERHRAGDYR